MKNKIKLLLLSLLFLASISNAQHKVNDFATDSSTLWKKSTLNGWIKHYQYQGYYQLYNSGQVANVMEIDLNDPEAGIVFADSKPSDSLSSVVKGIPNALAAIHLTFTSADLLKS